MSTASNLRHRVLLQQPIPIEDGYGNARQVWADVAEVWADVAPLQSRERLAAAQVQSIADHRVMIRYMPGVLSTWRIVWLRGDGNVAMEITGDPVDVGGRRRWLEITASTGVRGALDAVAGAASPGATLTVPAGTEYVVP